MNELILSSPKYYEVGPLLFLFYKWEVVLIEIK